MVAYNGLEYVVTLALSILVCLPSSLFVPDVKGCERVLNAAILEDNAGHCTADLPTPHDPLIYLLFYRKWRTSQDVVATRNTRHAGLFVE